MSDFNKIKTGRGAAYLFIDSTLGIFFAYFFWFFLTKFTSTEVIGITATIVSLAIIFTAVALMAVPVGVQRFLGKSFSENLLEQAKVFVKASVLLISIGIFVSSILILFFIDLIIANYDIDILLIFIAILLVASTCFRSLFRGVIISSLKTKILPIVSLVSGILKIGLAIVLVSIGTEVLGVLIGFASFTILSSILLAVNVIMIFNSIEKKSELQLKTAIRNTFSSSVVSWIPDLIRRPGMYLGTIVVFGFQGASDAGVYFIGFSVFQAILLITSVLLTIGLPLLSGMKDGRKRLVWRLIKTSLVFGLPITSIVMFYAGDILQVFGKEYSDDSLTLVILLSSMLPLVVGIGIRTLVYAYGNYRQVLVIGMGINLPRIILYFVLIPIYGTSGAAISFTIGSIVGFIVSLIIAKKVGLEIYAKDLMIIFTIPTALGFILSYIEIPLVVSIIIILLGSYVSFFRIGIIKNEELNDLVIILPKKISGPIQNILTKFIK